jgi:D-serine deaminase-like pyridoxal phosphate-dependent protein
MTSLYQQYIEALASVEAPALLVDMNALDENIAWATANSGGKKIRLATKSMRCVELIKYVLASHPIFQGLMTYDLREALWLRSLGFGDILMGYPTTDTLALNVLAKNPAGIILMVDLISHLDLLEEIASRHQQSFSICLDVDLSMDLPGIRFGVYRSSIQHEQQLKKILEHLKLCPHLKLVGLMGYEAQIAGVGDKHSWLMRFLKRLSLPQLQQRRQKLLSVITSFEHELTLINGGGTGSLKNTATEDVVTEVTVGSGFYCPALFDNYQSFTLRPAMAYSLPIVRRPTEDIFTALGGGYIASGEIGVAKQPLPYLPSGISLLKHEGAGEVQTPFKYQGDEELKVGNLIFMRHAKAGEPCERFNHIHLIRDGKYVKLTPTYRGEGQAFL